MFDIGLPEFIMLVVLGVIMFGPEKMPELARKGARVLHYLRGIANNAQAQLREELGPEYANLQLTDLTPRALIQKHLLDDIQEELDDVKSELDGIKNDFNKEIDGVRGVGQSLATDLTAQADDLNKTLNGMTDSIVSITDDPSTRYLVTAPYDPEAT